MAKWIKKAHIKKGALSKQLDIPEKENIPMGLLNVQKQEKQLKILLRQEREELKLLDYLKEELS